MLILFFSCNQEEVIQLEEAKDITIEEVKEAFNARKKQNANARTNGSDTSIDILWDLAIYKELNVGDVLFFPTKSIGGEEGKRYVSSGEGTKRFPVDYTSFGRAYKDEKDEVVLEYVMPVPTENTAEFTGYFLVSDWGEEVKQILVYENGNLIGQTNPQSQNEISNRSGGNCSIIDHWWCVQTSVGDRIVATRCTYDGSTMVCEPDELAPPDPSNPGGGGGGSANPSGPNGLCAHPFIEGMWVDCDAVICSENYVADENGECVPDCGENMVLNSEGNCVCKQGFVSDGEGGCTAITTGLEDISNCNELSTRDNFKLKNVVDNYLTKCTNLQIFEYVVGEEKKFCFKIDGTQDVPGGYNYSTSDITFKSSELINETTFGEEFFHGYQDLFYGGLNQYSNVGRSNIEFEAKLYHDLTHGGLCCLAFEEPGTAVFTEYLLWLSEVSNDFTQLPNWSEISDKYFYFMKQFINEKPIYNYPIDYQLIPNAVLNLNDC
ncbi:hypothetical protein GCM10011506_26320 [Marivirga lumbricoides]|uniref:EGF-like domain-containing protein n=1 Tax=Marivirga lumbricoides TaxID=1046115 RepID=A0ABQ1MFZ5_9BACT|nr:hypothetical protein GCM10011506_26320 [Marivirga lumbricoides]